MKLVIVLAEALGVSLRLGHVDDVDSVRTSRRTECSGNMERSPRVREEARERNEKSNDTCCKFDRMPENGECYLSNVKRRNTGCLLSQARNKSPRTNAFNSNITHMRLYPLVLVLHSCCLPTLQGRVDPSSTASPSRAQ